MSSLSLSGSEATGAPVGEAEPANRGADDGHQREGEEEQGGGGPAGGRRGLPPASRSRALHDSQRTKGTRKTPTIAETNNFNFRIFAKTFAIKFCIHVY